MQYYDRNREQKTATYTGPGFLSILTLIFITLKLTGVIAWSWFWVLSPLIFAGALWVILLVIIAIAYVKLGR